jgi:hypothetical protein
MIVAYSSNLVTLGSNKILVEICVVHDYDE